MPSFAFQARDTAGRHHSGVVEAATPSAVAQTLRRRGWVVTGVKPASGDGAEVDLLTQLNPGYWLPPRSVDIELSCKQMAVMLRGGLTLLTALQALEKQASRASLRRIWHSVTGRIQAGTSLATAMHEAKVFPSLLVQLVRVGEQTGNLEQAVERAADTMESRRRLRANLLTALAYPSLVLVAAIGVTAFMVVGVIPKLRTFLEGLGRKLPAITQLLVDISDAARIYLPHFIIGTLILIGLGVAIYFHPAGRVAFDRRMLRVPVIGNLVRLAGTASFARALGILLRSGITLLEGLRTTEDLLGNRYLASRVTAARQAVIQGGALSDPLTTAHAFAPMLARMVAIGESAGTLDEVLDEVAKFHETQLQAAIRQLSVIVEPLIIVVVGTIVGFVYIAFFMALFSAGGA
ncbi:MAG: type II secretion system F family protein [Planctomycetaceae bacterium]|nr:type II secretion system F family protein [Planctomycetaceae bacterium]